ncbi:uncharacterized protein Z519_07855 [Cladophialophora bantiana CBS 173.52]|uniref:N-acetyltransferase domain-containing protein n=1 Tax=Cladophialophora bantiana (strain ATCC 10958 / CBS 173.52 / CDC B-1940 / NIH 8579) TaxID=1442370 RepID=A0A0D2HM56_CLAB1|nr:uncharacterized protein Z519_07855 [Cladophialophora bantiana CBS 173.52]KIW91885.1 hypothetical protein Z519_07855 [Cladophialophora bantiana CBS 173.52]
MSTEVRITASPDQEWLDSFISLLSRSYLTTPLTTAFITEIDNSSPTADVSQVMTPERLTKHFTLGITAAAKSNVVLVESGDFTAAALFEPPDFCGIPPSQARRNPGPILQEWRSTARMLKAKYLSIPDQGEHSYDQPAAPSQSSGAPSEDPYPADFNKDIDFETRPFYHLAMIARDPDAPPDKSRKAFKACMDYFLNKARDEGVPVWLETASESAMKEYEGMGFRVCEQVVIGKGRVNEKGWPTEGGKGVVTWAMIWDEHLN